jgi:hypothetical protein
MDVTEFRKAIRHLATFAEDLWIQNEFYKGYILQSDPIDSGHLERLANRMLEDGDVRKSAHKMFAPIFSVLDSTESADLIEELLKKEIPPGKPN